jgi:hypothetical protein
LVHIDGAGALRNQRAIDVRFGSQADVRTAKRHVRFTPDSDHESDFSQKPMSALTPKADMCSARADVGYWANSGHEGLAGTLFRRKQERAAAQS